MPSKERMASVSVITTSAFRRHNYASSEQHTDPVSLFVSMFQDLGNAVLTAVHPALHD